MWRWLTLPIALEALSIAFLAWTIIETRRKKIPVWKDSMLATLFHGVSQDAYPDIAAASKVSTMESSLVDIV